MAFAESLGEGLPSQLLLAKGLKLPANLVHCPPTMLDYERTSVKGQGSPTIAGLVLATSCVCTFHIELRIGPPNFSGRQLIIYVMRGLRLDSYSRRMPS